MRVFAPGDTVAASGGRVELYADASQESIVLDTLGAGVMLEVLDVNGDFEGYPVEVEGHGWARVRAADGLVGWVMTDQVEVQ
jgi:SH3-like domain-containing protein